MAFKGSTLLDASLRVMAAIPNTEERVLLAVDPEWTSHYAASVRRC